MLGAAARRLAGRGAPLVARHGGAALVLARGIRAGRSGRGVRAVAAPVVVQRQREPPRKPSVVATLPSYIRVRDLAKRLKRPIDEVLKRSASRAHRKFHMTIETGHDARTELEFSKVKEIILPFAKAQEVAAGLGISVAYEDIEPVLTPFRAGHMLREHSVQRRPVIAVMGHVDHGKTTLMDALGDSARPLAPFETRGITQKINVSGAALSPALEATFLDTPGHFHFFRMRSSAAQVADLVVLVVAADEGVRLQTEESIGAIEDAEIPVVVCINKMDLLDDADEDDRGRVEDIVAELRSFVALQECPIIQISGKTGENLDALRAALCDATDDLAAQGKLGAYVGPARLAEGLVLESIASKGRGTVLRVLLKHGVLKPKDHFVAGMIHGSVRSVRDAAGNEVAVAVPGMVVDVIYGNKSKYVDAPNEFGFFVLPEDRARDVIEQRQMAMDFEDSIVHRHGGGGSAGEDEEEEEEDEDEEIDESDLVETKSIVVKADQAGSLTSIQDTVDDMPGISTVRLGIGAISAKDVDVAINGKCPIFGFNVKLRRREARLAAARGVRVVLRDTVHELIEEIAAFEQQQQE